MFSDQSEFQKCMSKLKYQISSLSNSKILNESLNGSLTNRTSTLKISNRADRYRLEYGHEFKDWLDPRDQVLQHQFTIDIEIRKEGLGSEDNTFTQSRTYQTILDKIKRFLTESISNVVSIAFKFMCRGELESTQAKQFAAKNMMVNVHAIFKQTIKSLQANETLRNQINIDDVKNDLALEIDNILNNILINLADCYPQAPISGGTPRMREAINPVNRGDDPKNDFIYLSGIKIKDYIKLNKQNNQYGQVIQTPVLEENQDYTAFIMEVINSTILVTQQNKSDSLHRTVFEVFTQFNEHLFFMAQQKDYQQLLSSIEETNLYDDISQQSKTKIDSVCSIFESIFPSQENRETLIDKTNVTEVNKLWESAKQGIEGMKKTTKYAMNQKIPTSVLPFQRFQIKNKHFTAKHASILRILTKWAQSLEGIFQESEKILKERLYPFVNLQNQLCELKCGDSSGDLKLNKQLEEQYKQLRKKFRVVLKNSYNFIGKMFGDQKQSVTSSINRFTETRLISSKINAVLTSLMLSYINMLIHHLLRAGRRIKTQKGVQDLNLLVFRVSDLMRSKYQCRQSAFISVLDTMYLMDSKQSMHNKFKIVKVRNKLDEPANNIIINYLFMGKVECELQLSIQDVKGKQKHYYTFSHFVYELTRGKFGPLAECAMMISQIDPMIVACKSGYYQEKTDNLSLIRQKQMSKQSKKRAALSGTQKSLFQSHTKQDKKQNEFQLKDAFFECSSCNSLITTENLSKFLEKPEHKICYKCVLKKDHSEDYLPTNIKSVLHKIKRHRIRSYSKLSSLQQEKFLLTMDLNGELDLFLIYYIVKDFKTFMIKIDPRMINALAQKKEINFQGFDYIDITKDMKNSIKKDTQPKVLSYIFMNIGSIPEDLLQILGLQKQRLQDCIKELINEFLMFRGEKEMIKKIKLKTEIIRASQQEGNILDRVCRVLVMNQGRRKQDIVARTFLSEVDNAQIEDKLINLRYKKQKHLDITNVMKITSQRVGFTSIPRWIISCTNLRKLDLDQNSIKAVNKGQLPSTLEELSLKKNGLESLDISGLQNLLYLYVRNNKLQRLEIPEESVLKVLSIRNNSINKIAFLPPTLEGLWVDRSVVVNYNFEDLKKLKELWVFNGQTRKEEVKKLPKDVKYETRD